MHFISYLLKIVKFARRKQDNFYKKYLQINVRNKIYFEGR